MTTVLTPIEALRATERALYNECVAHAKCRDLLEDYRRQNDNLVRANEKLKSEANWANSVIASKSIIIEEFRRKNLEKQIKRREVCQQLAKIQAELEDIEAADTLMRLI